MNKEVDIMFTIHVKRKNRRFVLPTFVILFNTTCVAHLYFKASIEPKGN